MRAGQLNRMVTIRTVTLVPDGGGGNTEIPTDVPDIPARVEPLDGRELVEAMKVGLQRPHRFTLRYRTGMTGATRIVYALHTFDVKSVVDPEEAHRELIILTEEIV